MFNIFKKRKTDPDFVSALSKKRRRMHRNQRVDRGWSDIDAWGGDMYFAKVIYQMLEHYKTKKTTPGSFFPNDYEGHDKKISEEAHTKWLKVLDDIIIPLKKYITFYDFDYPLEEEIKIHEDAKIAMHLFADHLHDF